MNTSAGISLTIIDQQILQSYCVLLPGLADYLGDGYEIVLHSLADLEHSVIAIFHGEHTGRSVGAPITNRALEMLDYFQKSGTSYGTYFSTNKEGEPLKSTTIAICGEKNRIIGLLCINFYMNTSLYKFVHSFTNEQQSLFSDNNKKEIFASNIDDMISSMFESARKEVYEDQSISASNKNKAIIKVLYDKGIFKIKDSVPKIANLLGISKNTVYLHLRNFTETEDEAK